MKKKLINVWFFVLIFFYTLPSSASEQPAKPLDSALPWLKQSNQHVVDFNDIPKTQYEFKPGILEARVDKSSSALVFPLEKPIQVKSVSIKWSRQGTIKRSADKVDEKSKAGDDAWFRLGLIIAGPAPMIPFFAPAWIKRLKEVMTLSSNQMIYFIAGSLQDAGAVWPSPYTDSIIYSAMSNQDQGDGWWVSQGALKKEQQVVGFWIMADGDNTGSQFTTLLDLEHIQIVGESEPEAAIEGSP